MTHTPLDRQKLEKLAKLSEKLDERLKTFNDESEKMAQKWQLWAQMKQNQVQKQDSTTLS